MEVDHQFLEVQGLRTHFIAAGGAGQEAVGRPIVILLHGGGIDSARLSWDLLIPELASACQVIAPDWPGYGLSAPLDRTCSIDFLVNFLADFMNALGIQRASLAGISMGGGAALGFALRFPERVDRLVLVDSYGLQRDAPFPLLSYLYVRLPGVNALTWKLMRNPSMARWSLRSLLRRPGALTEELFDLVMEEMRRPDAGRAFMTFQQDEITLSGTRTSFLDRLNEISAPTLIVHGTLDTLVPHEAVREAHIRIPGSQLHWMEGCGHWPQRDHPAEFNRLARRFLCVSREERPGLNALDASP